MLEILIQKATFIIFVPIYMSCRHAVLLLVAYPVPLFSFGGFWPAQDTPFYQISVNPIVRNVYSVSLKICTVLDDSSRKILAIDEFGTVNTVNTIVVVERAVHEYGHIRPLP